MTYTNGIGKSYKPFLLEIRRSYSHQIKTKEEHMSYELLHFRGSDEILKEKNLENVVQITMEYLCDALYGAAHRREILRMVMDEMDWRSGDDLNILNGRRYAYKGLMKRVAIDGTFSAYEYIQNALFRLQLGFDMRRIDMGIVLVTAQRSEKSPLGTSRQLIFQEIELLHPTISLPVAIALFDLGKPGEYLEEAAQTQGSPSPGPLENGTNNFDGDHHDSTTKDQNGIIPPMPSIRRRTTSRRTRVAINS
jgi:hypothetical protein